MTGDVFADATEATWPPAATSSLGPWLLRDGKGGGKRVSAATLAGEFDAGAIADAEAAMRGAGEQPLFQLRPGDEALDEALAARGYAVVDPVVIYAAKLADLAQPAPPHMTTFPHWPPLGIAVDLWAEGGIGPARLDVMHRVQGPKCAILSRNSDRAAGVAFVALHGPIAMLHALEVTPAMRRKGSARHILQAAIQWAQDNGATDLGLAVTTANTAARALYASFGMRVVGQYHYRQL
jgi:GNAT superfamily N-acetyltransferase